MNESSTNFLNTNQSSNNTFPTADNAVFAQFSNASSTQQANGSLGNNGNMQFTQGMNLNLPSATTLLSNAQLNSNNLLSQNSMLPLNALSSNQSQMNLVNNPYFMNLARTGNNFNPNLVNAPAVATPPFMLNPNFNNAQQLMQGVNPLSNGLPANGKLCLLFIFTSFIVYSNFAHRDIRRV